MTKEVMVSIKGLQFDQSADSEEIETIQWGQYYKKNGTHYVIYDELMEGCEEPTKNIIKFRERELNLTKRGLVNVYMVFEENKKNAQQSTPNCTSENTQKSVHEPAEKNTDDSCDGLTAEVIEKTFAGGQLRVVLKTSEGQEIVASRYGIDTNVSVGEKVHCCFLPTDAVLVDREERSEEVLPERSDISAGGTNA